MKDTDYTYAVARVRANELNLLSPAELTQLINAPDTGTAERLLSDKGWDIPENGEFDICERELEKVIALFSESAPESGLAQALIIGNDYSNLKAAVKCTFSAIDPSDYYTAPCLTDTKIITEAISKADYAILPEHLKGCAEKAYKAVSGQQSGQLAEMIIDRCSLEERLRRASASGSGILKKICGITAFAANVKTALRCVSTGKSRAVSLDAMCACGADNEAILDNAESNEKMAEYISLTEYSFLADGIKEGFAAFEKLCDNKITALLLEAKAEIYGPDPLAAYYYAKLAEAKNIRIILSAKANGIPAETITGRVRDIYV